LLIAVPIWQNPGHCELLSDTNLFTIRQFVPIIVIFPPLDVRLGGKWELLLLTTRKRRQSLLWEKKLEIF